MAPAPPCPRPATMSAAPARVRGFAPGSGGSPPPETKAVFVMRVAGHSTIRAGRTATPASQWAVPLLKEMPMHGWYSLPPPLPTWLAQHHAAAQRQGLATNQHDMR